MWLQVNNELSCVSVSFPVKKKKKKKKGRGGFSQRFQGPHGLGETPHEEGAARSPWLAVGVTILIALFLFCLLCGL